MSKKKSNHDEEGSEDEVAAVVEENSAEDLLDETGESFEARINSYVRIHLSRSPGSNRDNYKDGLVYQARKDLVTEFLKATILKKCQNERCLA